MNTKFKDFAIFTVTMFFTIILELALNALQVKDENIYLVFVLSILIIIIESKSIVYGLLASIVTVLSFNFFITEPKFTFVVDDPNNYVSFAMFVVVSFMVNSLVVRLQKQIRVSRENEERINVLYNISTDILHSRNSEEICEHMVNRLNEQLSTGVSIVTVDGNVYGKPIDTDYYEPYIQRALDHNMVIRGKTVHFKKFPSVIFPVASGSQAYGVVILEDAAEVSDEECLFVENVIEEIVIALDKQHISAIQEETKMQVEAEKFKSSLLKGLSHDLKTPLTMIQSGSEFLSESFDSIEDGSKKQLIKDIYDESVNLSSFVNNLLDLTKLESGDMKLNRNMEAADDVIFEVLGRMKRRLADIDVSVKQKEDVVMVYADTELLSQVFYNLIDNAIIHTRPGTKITIGYEKLDDCVSFYIRDNGGGISEEKMDMIFGDFYALSVNEDKRRSHGLGLSICKSIVEAHGGTISAENNEDGGATFTFTIKDKEE